MHKLDSKSGIWERVVKKSEETEVLVFKWLSYHLKPQAIKATRSFFMLIFCKRTIAQLWGGSIS